MSRLNHRSNFMEHNLNQLINKTLEQCTHLQGEYMLDSKALEIFGWFEHKLLKVKNLVNKDIRFNYLAIQDEMDLKYKEDPEIGGYIIYLRFNDKQNEHLARLGGTINRKRK